MTPFLRRSFISLISLSAIVLLFAPQASAQPTPTKGTLGYVVDGDTLAVEFDDWTEKVRLIGIDTPESRVNNRAKLQASENNKDVKTILALGKQATMAMKEIAPKGAKLRLEYDVRKRDKYGRLLAYVYREDGVMLNEEIVKRGYAQLLTMPPNVMYVDRFQKALKHARDGHHGLWAGDGF
jgi:micrococcal nuclease